MIGSVAGPVITLEFMTKHNIYYENNKINDRSGRDGRDLSIGMCGR